jgi:hypothetical protein
MLLPVVLTLAAALAMLVGVDLYDSRWSRKARIKRALEATARTPVRQLAGDIVRVTGRVEQRGMALTTPVSRRTCVAYELELEVDTSSFWEHSRRRTLSQTQVCRFAVADETGAVLIEARGHFELVLRPHISVAEGWSDLVDQQAVMPLLRAAGISTRTGWGRTRTVRFREAFIEEGGIVSVHGRAHRELRPDGERESLREPPAVSMLIGSAEAPLKIIDEPVALARAPGPA